MAKRDWIDDPNCIGVRPYLGPIHKMGRGRRRSVKRFIEYDEDAEPDVLPWIDHVESIAEKNMDGCYEDWVESPVPEGWTWVDDYRVVIRDMRGYWFAPTTNLERDLNTKASK